MCIMKKTFNWQTYSKHQFLLKKGYFFNWQMHMNAYVTLREISMQISAMITSCRHGVYLWFVALQRRALFSALTSTPASSSASSVSLAVTWNARSPALPHVHNQMSPCTRLIMICVIHSWSSFYCSLSFSSLSCYQFTVAQKIQRAHLIAVSTTHGSSRSRVLATSACALTRTRCVVTSLPRGWFDAV